MPKIEEQKNVAQCDRKNQIVHAALKVFCKKGFDFFDGLCAVVTGRFFIIPQPADFVKGFLQFF